MNLTSKLIAKLLVLCGISLTCTACYGIPMPTYMTDIEGMVTDEATEQPIEGIKIGVSHYAGDMSDVDGKFNFKCGIPSPMTITITVEDIDGPENGGNYATETREIKLVQENFAPRGRWNGRNTEWVAGLKIDFELKHAEIPEEYENE